MLMNAPKNFPTKTMCRGMAFANVNRSVPRSSSPEIESKGEQDRDKTQHIANDERPIQRCEIGTDIKRRFGCLLWIEHPPDEVSCSRCRRP